MEICSVSTFLTDVVGLCYREDRGSGWSVKIRRERLIRCVLRYGRWDGMT